MQNEEEWHNTITSISPFCVLTFAFSHDPCGSRTQPAQLEKLLASPKAERAEGKIKTQNAKTRIPKKQPGVALTSGCYVNRGVICPVSQTSAVRTAIRTERAIARREFASWGTFLFRVGW